MRRLQSIGVVRGATRLCAALAAAALTLAAAAARAQTADTRPTLAVANFDNAAMGLGGARTEDYEPLRKGVADLLITELAANPGVRVVERDQLQRLLDEQGLGASGRVDPATAVRLGRLLGARHIVLGAFVADRSGEVRLVARTVDVETGVTANPASARGKRDDLLALVSQLAERFSRELRLPAIEGGGRVRPAANDAEAARATTADAREAAGADARAGGDTKERRWRALLAYSRALSEEDRGNAAAAARLYREFLALAPPRYAPQQRAAAVQRLARLERGA